MFWCSTFFAFPPRTRHALSVSKEDIVSSLGIQFTFVFYQPDRYGLGTKLKKSCNALLTIKDNTIFSDVDTLCHLVG